MLKKSILFFLVFLLAFSIFVLAKAPARVVWDTVLQHDPSVQSQLRSLGVSVKGLSGSIWDGSALVQYKGIASILDWDIKVSDLYTLSLPVFVNVDSQAGELEAELFLGVSDVSLQLPKGEIDLAVLNPAVRSQRVTLDGTLLIKDLVLTLESLRPTSLKGLVSWSGGDIAYPAQRSMHQRTLPSFRGVLETEDSGTIKAGVRDSGGSFDVIEATLSAEGEAFVKVKRRLLDLSDEFWPQNSSEEDVVFKVKKKIY